MSNISILMDAVKVVQALDKAVDHLALPYGTNHAVYDGIDRAREALQTLAELLVEAAAKTNDFPEAERMFKEFFWRGRLKFLWKIPIRRYIRRCYVRHRISGQDISFREL